MSCSFDGIVRMNFSLGNVPTLILDTHAFKVHYLRTTSGFLLLVSLETPIDMQSCHL